MSDAYTDIDFLETDAEKVLLDMITEYEEITGRTLKPASPERLFISWCASIIVQQRVIINETAKMNIPRYAKGKYLDSLAELFRDTKRLPASKAVTTVRCHISEEQMESVFIPAGTRVTAGGKVIFATTELLEITAGNLYGDVEAECMSAGEEGNGFKTGQLKEIIDVYDYFAKIENITETAGGAEEESDESYYSRMRESIESFSTAGPVNGYIYWTKTVSPAVKDVAVKSPGPCLVDVRVLLQDGKEATEAVLKEIEERLNKSDIRPLTDLVTVSKPDPVEFTVDATFYVARPDIAKAAVIEKNVRQAVEDFIKWQTEKMGRDINPSYLTKMMMEAGAKRVEIREPAFKSITETEVGKLTGKTVLNGGIEDV